MISLPEDHPAMCAAYNKTLIPMPDEYLYMQAPVLSFPVVVACNVLLGVCFLHVHADDQSLTGKRIEGMTVCL